LDLWYIRNASFALDARILMHTVRTVLFGERVDREAIHEAWRDLRDNRSRLTGSDAGVHNLA
jgi:hypothetical protein